MDYVYIDESGSEGNGSKYLIFASISTTEPRVLEKSIKRLWDAKPQYHFRGEFHATKLDDATRKRILLRISELDIIIRYRAIEKQNRGRSFIHTYYSELERFIMAHGPVSSVVVDKKDTVSQRTKTIRALGVSDSYKGVIFDESHKIKQLQAADIIAWSVGRVYERGDSSFYDLIKHKESPLF